MMKCDDASLEALLDADDKSPPDGTLAQVASHVESCPRCQSRLTQLAANQCQWRDVPARLSPAELDADIYAESLVAGRHWQPPKNCSSALAKSLLSPSSHPELLGRLGRYEIERFIGSGGMGVVFKGHDTELNRPVAVKLLAPYLAESGSARSRFAREARAAAAVVDDHVVPIYNVESKSDEVPYLVMQYVAGGSLQQRIDRDGPLSVKEILRIGLQVARGLAAAHAQGLIHRDVKPSNILLDEGVDRALLADFGLARAEDEASLTRSGLLPGTPHYMSPEQIRGEAIDGRSDLFSLGCVLYALCTGHPPFRAESSYAVLRLITDEPPRSMHDINAEIPAWLEGIIFKLLSKSKEDRIASAEELAAILEGCLAHVQHPATASLPVAAASLDGNRRRRRPTWKRRIAAALAALAMLLGGVVIVLETDKGTLTIESETDNVPIRIVQGDRLVEKVSVHREGTKLRLRAGKYTLEMEGADSRIELTDNSVTIQRGQTQIVTIRYTASGPVAPLTDERSLDVAVREFNNLHRADAQGRPQPPLTKVEVNAALLWKRDHGQLSDDVIGALWLRPNYEELMLPAGWQLTGGMVRERSDYGVIHTWQVNLETNGLTDPITIRHVALRPAVPTSQPRENSDDNSDDNDDAPWIAAIEQFNAAQEELDEYADSFYAFLPLTIDQVIAAIALVQPSAAEAADSAAVERLQQMVTSGELPAGIRFERVRSRTSEIGQIFTVDSVLMHVPDVNEPGSMSTLVIRDRFIELDFKNHAATHWGTPGRHGIQAGVRLVPAEPSYSHGQVVDIEFLYRSVLSEEIPATLPQAFQFGHFRGIRLVRLGSIQPKWPAGAAATSLGNEPLVVRGYRMQICFDDAEEAQDGVNLKAITRPSAMHYIRLEVPDIANDSLEQYLDVGWGLRFAIEAASPPDVLPTYEGHYYLHWGSTIPGHQLPPRSTPDASYVDPFMLGMSLGPAELSRIPAYFAGGLEVTKVAPHSPAEKVGIEVGDIILAWQGHQIRDDDPSGDFLKYSLANRQLKEYQEVLKKSGRSIAWGSGGTSFVLLDHRTGEVIDIAPWYGATANGDLTKAQIVERLLQRRQSRAR